MAKQLVKVLMLSAAHIRIDEEDLHLKCGEVYELEPKTAKALIKSGAAECDAVNIAWHTGDMKTFNRLIKGGQADAGLADHGKAEAAEKEEVVADAVKADELPVSAAEDSDQPGQE